MSYLILALGGLLSLGGALALHYSYEIVQIERGWAGVIAGSTALSCGVVTIALGLILHRLSRFYELLKAAAGTAPLSAELNGHGIGSEPREEPLPPPAADGALIPEPAPLPSAMPPAAGLRMWPLRQARASFALGRGILKPRAPSVPSAPRAREASRPPPKEKEPFTFSGPARGDEGAASTTFDPDPSLAIPNETAEDIGQEQERRSPPLPGEVTPAVSENGSNREPWLTGETVRSGPEFEQVLPGITIAPRVPESHELKDLSWPAETASIETILQQEFYLEPEAGKKDAAEPSPQMLAEEDAELTLPVDGELEAGARLAESASGEDANPAPAAHGDTLAIAGRYESEGTSYVMYADGSIEARSAHSVFHFKSMAELKSFMDSQAQNARNEANEP
ncbi:MAG: hypothetical protein L0Y57_05675 [Beijerinckiaceae bacterium]|nr:hypothetical protein [Beijerinckiaceae bacterium]